MCWPFNSSYCSLAGMRNSMRFQKSRKNEENKIMIYSLYKFWEPHSFLNQTLDNNDRPD